MCTSTILFCISPWGQSGVQRPHPYEPNGPFTFTTIGQDGTVYTAYLQHQKSLPDKVGVHLQLAHKRAFITLNYVSQEAQYTSRCTARWECGSALVANFCFPFPTKQNSEWKRGLCIRLQSISSHFQLRLLSLTRLWRCDSLVCSHSPAAEVGESPFVREVGWSTWREDWREEGWGSRTTKHSLMNVMNFSASLLVEV